MSLSRRRRRAISLAVFSVALIVALGLLVVVRISRFAPQDETGAAALKSPRREVPPANP